MKKNSLWREKFFEKEHKKNVFDLKRLTAMYEMRYTDKLCRLFIYEGLPFPQHELEFRALMAGYAGVVRDSKKGIMTAWGSMSGVTQYDDIFTNFTYSAPTARGGTLEIGKNAVILRNTVLCESMYDYVRCFASLNAHINISLRMALVNSRYQDILKTTNPSQADTITAWYEGLFNGEMLAIIDDSPLSEFVGTDGSIKTLDLTRTTDVDFNRFSELENELMRTFYREIGIRWNKDKKGNLVAGEVEQDDMLLRFNVSDMLKQREDFCTEYNKVFGGNISVKLAIPIESEGKNNDDDSRISGEHDGDDSVSGESDESDGGM